MGLLLLPLLALTLVSARAQPAVFASPVDVWRGFDPAAAPLEVETLRTWTEDGADWEKLRFTSETLDGKPVRVFAIRGIPVGAKRAPGVLHIHGGGQTAAPEWVRFWTRRGYACLSFDHCGNWPGRTEFTDWGPVPHANHARAAGGHQVRPTPRESSWYHWAVAARRALTVLASDPRVDRRKLGIFGISVGGNLTWMVAGSDPRVRAAVAIYGSGYNSDPRRMRWGLGDPGPDGALFRRTLSPEAHASYVNCPILHLNASNDHHAHLDDGCATLAAARGPVRQAFTPHYIHHIEPEQGADLPLWMDWHLRGGKPFPGSPELRLRLDEAGEPRAAVRASRRVEVARVRVYYSLGEKWPPARFWRSAVARASGKGWSAALPVMDPREEVTAFANVTYRSGVCLSSSLARVIPAQLGAARASLAWSPVLEQGADPFESWYFTRAYTDPSRDQVYLRTGEDPEAGRFLTLDPALFGDPADFTLSSHVVGDPQFRGKEGAALAFRCRGGWREPLAVSAIERDWLPGSRVYTARVAAEDLGAGWRSVVLTRERFRAADGGTLASWQQVDRLEISGKTTRAAPPCFQGFRWATASAERARHAVSPPRSAAAVKPSLFSSRAARALVPSSGHVQ